MPGIPKEVYSRLRETLLECGPFNNNSQLSAIFANASLAPWRSRIPEASNPADRVEAIIYFLMDKRHSKNQRNALVLLLEVLRDRIDENDACYERLTNLLEDLTNVFQNSSNAAQQHNEPIEMVSTSYSGRGTAFISYSQKDSKYLQELQTHLKYYIRKDNIDVWDDTRMAAGSHRQETIEKALLSAKVAVLLISPDFLDSDFIAHHELQPVLIAEKQGTLTILSVIIRHSAFEDTELARLLPVNDPAKPLATMALAKRDEVWKKVASIVWNILKEHPSDL